MKTREDVIEWLKSDGFKIFCELKHGPIGEVLALLADGCISRSKAAEAIAELLVGRTPLLPETGGSEFAEYEVPGETVRELRWRIAELETALRQLLESIEAHCLERLDSGATEDQRNWRECFKRRMEKAHLVVRKELKTDRG